MAIAAAVPPADNDRSIRVMIVDDALVVRGIVARWLQEEPGIEVVATHRSAKNALDDLARTAPDVVILDIEMPDMDGVTALPLLLEKKPDISVIIASTLTRRNAELSIRCLNLGATDCLAKPQTSGEMTSTVDFRRELTNRIRALGSRAVSRRRVPLPPKVGVAVRSAPAVVSTSKPDFSFAKRSGELPKLRKFSTSLPRALVVGSSTGGPQALAAFFAGVKPILSRIPVLVTQHMPPSFTTILAEHIGRVSGTTCHEPTDGEAIRAGVIYIAPGGYHMKVASGPNGPVIRITDEPPVNFCKPAVDPLFHSALQVWGASLAAVVLTGMGADGARGAVAIADAGGSVIAQDEETSVVWGMPGATAQAGACAAILPLQDIAPKVVNLISGARS